MSTYREKTTYFIAVAVFLSFIAIASLLSTGNNDKLNDYFVVKGIILEQTLLPIKSAFIGIELESESGSDMGNELALLPQRYVESDKDGAFSFRIPKRYSELKLVIYKNGYHTKTFPIKDKSAQSTNLGLVVLDKALVVVGKVNLDGAHIEQNTELLLIDNNSDTIPDSLKTLQADIASNGSFRLNGIGYGTYTVGSSVKEIDLVISEGSLKEITSTNQVPSSISYTYLKPATLTIHPGSKGQYKPILNVKAENVSESDLLNNSFDGKIYDARTLRPITYFKLEVYHELDSECECEKHIFSKEFDAQEGNFLISSENFPKLGKLTFIASSEDYAVLKIEKVNLNLDRRVKLNFPMRGSGLVIGILSGQAKGEAIQSAKLDVFKVGNDLPVPYESLYSDTEGRFSVEDVPLGSYLISASAPGYKSKVFDVDVLADTQNNPPLKLKMANGLSINGQLFLADGITNTFGTIGYSRSGANSFQSVSTDEYGNFHINNIESGWYYLNGTSKYGTSNTIHVNSRSYNGQVKLVVEAGGTISGHITGAAVSDLRSGQVSASSLIKSNRSAIGRISDDGEFSVAGLPQGDVRLEVSVGSKNITREVVLDKYKYIEIDINDIYDLNGKIVRNGAPASGIYVKAIPIGAKESDADTFSSSLGLFSLNGLTEGRYKVVISGGSETIVDVPHDDDIELSLHDFSISGRVVNAELGKAAEGVQIDIMLKGIVKGSTFTDQNGRYIIRDIGPGDYFVSSYSSTYILNRKLVSVNESKTDINFHMEKDSSVKLKVLDRVTKNPVIGVLLIATSNVNQAERTLINLDLDSTGSGNIGSSLINHNLFFTTWAYNSYTVVNWNGSELIVELDRK